MCFMLTRDADIVTMRNKFTSEWLDRRVRERIGMTSNRLGLSRTRRVHI